MIENKLWYYPFNWFTLINDLSIAILHHAFFCICPCLSQLVQPIFYHVTSWWSVKPEFIGPCFTILVTIIIKIIIATVIIILVFCVQ